MSLKFCIRLWIFDGYQKSVKGLVIDVKESVTRLVTLMAVVFYSQRRHLAENWDIDNALLNRGTRGFEASSSLPNQSNKPSQRGKLSSCLDDFSCFAQLCNYCSRCSLAWHRRLLHNVQNTLDRPYWSNISKVQKYTRWKTLNFLVGRKYAKIR